MPSGTRTSEAPKHLRRVLPRTPVSESVPPLMLLMLLAAAAGADAARADEAEAERLALLARGRAVLRAMDRARCHGRDYGGWAAPVAARRGPRGSRERFERSVLDGNPVARHAGLP